MNTVDLISLFHLCQYKCVLMASVVFIYLFCFPHCFLFSQSHYLEGEKKFNPLYLFKKLHVTIQFYRKLWS